MTFNPSASLTALKTALTDIGYFSGGVLIGEPFGPVTTVTAAIFFMDLDAAQVTLSDTIDVWGICVRIYARGGMTPADAQTAELALANGVSEVWTALAGAFTLGGTVRAIDWAGEEAGHKMTAKWGHIVLGGTIFRVVDITVNLIVDGSATFVP